MNKSQNLQDAIYKHAIIWLISLVAYVVINYIAISSNSPQVLLPFTGCLGFIVFEAYTVILLWELSKATKRYELRRRDDNTMGTRLQKEGDGINFAGKY